MLSKKSVSLDWLAKVGGKLIWAFQSYRYLKSHLSSLFGCKSMMERKKLKVIRTPHKLRRDLTSLRGHLNDIRRARLVFNIAPICHNLSSPKNACIVSDASTKAIAGTLYFESKWSYWTLRINSLPLEVREKILKVPACPSANDICQLELLAVLISLALLAQRDKAPMIWVLCDNMGVVHLLNKIYSGQDQLAWLLQRAVPFLLKFVPNLAPHYISSKQNFLADGLSRETLEDLPSDWMRCSPPLQWLCAEGASKQQRVALVHKSPTQETLAEFVASANAVKTRQLYGTAAKFFSSFVAPEVPFPLRVPFVQAFIYAMTKTGLYKYNTILTYTKSLRSANSSFGYTLSEADKFCVNLALKAARRKSDGSLAQKRALQKEELVLMATISEVPDSNIPLEMLQVASLVTVFGLFRARETLALRYKDVSFGKDGKLMVDIVRSKTDQFGEGAQVIIGCVSNDPSSCANKCCPSHRLQRWLESVPVSHGNNLIFADLPYNQWRNDLKSIISYIAPSVSTPQPNDVGVHSLRRTGAQLMWAAGYSLFHIQEYGRWKSLALMDYLKGVTKGLSTSYAAAMLYTQASTKTIGNATVTQVPASTSSSGPSTGAYPMIELGDTADAGSTSDNESVMSSPIKKGVRVEPAKPAPAKQKQGKGANTRSG
ncbi:hypothetical protein FOZ61_001326 [Perkinsus olseni]|uniref:Tyr recombinase domain-containing protein n=1 Tax=Perkinsus olseni TaxID=32597 RepID=A0A7J6KRH1_PEROL|nr:hypothetical protein FOL46_002031 [Perkinsus olseni]KAF4649444.1 hypothetical protein FOZ61_001326 [Perkinsus olseni]